LSRRHIQAYDAAAYHAYLSPAMIVKPLPNHGGLTMTVPRSRIVNPAITPWYYCISHCVRNATLTKSPRRGDPKLWIENRLEELSKIFAIDVAGFNVMDSHFNVLAHLNVKVAKNWSKEEVLTRWARLFYPRDDHREPIKDLKGWIKEKQSDHKFVNTCRHRLVDLGWFMKCTKEPLSRLINEADGATGTFWAARYKSIAVIGEPALLAACACIDLSPVAAGIADLPEAALYTSVRLRVEWSRAHGITDALVAARRDGPIHLREGGRFAEGHWLYPIEDRGSHSAGCAGMFERMSLGAYFLVLDQTARLIGPGAVPLDTDAVEILERVGISAELWEQTIKQLLARSRPFGVAFSLDRKKLREAARTRGVHHVANLNGCPTVQRR
jgi:hypothetical protein